MPIRVFIVDDHALVRTGFRMILEGEGDIEVVGEADSAESALPEIRRLRMENEFLKKAAAFFARTQD